MPAVCISAIALNEWTRCMRISSMSESPLPQGSQGLTITILGCGNVPHLSNHFLTIGLTIPRKDGHCNHPRPSLFLTQPIPIIIISSNLTAPAPHIHSPFHNLHSLHAHPLINQPARSHPATASLPNNHTEQQPPRHPPSSRRDPRHQTSFSLINPSIPIHSRRAEGETGNLPPRRRISREDQIPPPIGTNKNNNPSQQCTNKVEGTGDSQCSRYCSDSEPRGLDPSLHDSDRATGPSPFKTR